MCLHRILLQYLLLLDRCQYVQNDILYLYNHLQLFQILSDTSYMDHSMGPVSYTHLTLPTTSRV